MGNNFMVANVNDAIVYRMSSGCASMPVEGGYMLLEWSDYYRRIREEGESLFTVGWRSSDADVRKSLILTYCGGEDNEITREWANDIVSALRDIEGYMRKYE